MRRSFLIFIGIFLLIPLSLLAQSPLLPPSHPVYDFLDRMDAAGAVESPLIGCKPLNRVRIAQLLDEAYEQAQEFPGRLSRSDRKLLAAYRWEFARDLHRAGISSAEAPHPDETSRLSNINDWMSDHNWFTEVFYRNGINFYSQETEEFDVYFDPRGIARIISQENESEPIIITSVGLTVRGQALDKLGLYIDVMDYTESGRSPYNTRTKLYEDRFGYVALEDEAETANYDIANFDLAVGGSFWELHAAKMPLRWGPGRSGQLLLSDWGTSFHQAQMGLYLGKHLRFVYVFGSLKTEPEIVDTLYENGGYYRTIEANKFIAAHRLEWDPHRRLRFGFSEAVIFGDREPELAYLIPVNLFYSAQHALGDEDNTVMGIDASWIVRDGWKVYGELLIDDISFGKLGSDFWGNKLGWLGGVYTVNPFNLPDIDLTLEVSQLRPYIYTHQYYVNVYSHWTSPLGYRYPPNSQTFYMNLGYRPHWRWDIDASWTHFEHGANTAELNAGGDIFTSKVNDTSEDAPFLGGDLQISNRFDLQSSYRLLLGLDLWARGSLCQFGGDDAFEWEFGFRWN
ncbi:capsule assembly Wzi family protein [bacterium]|nr:capsule assembly Wzi family protein [bacterium]MBU1650940.1 capsule assembly Wzi family protein [bacterium]MBU1882269.1 capsule assembly Wzi family protein [bacterium]